MASAIPASAYAERTVVIMTVEDRLTTSAHPQVLALRSPVLRRKLEKGGKQSGILIPDCDMEMFSIVLRWMYSDTISRPNDTDDILLLMQAYKVAFNHEIFDACEEIMEHITKWYEWNRLEIRVIDETAFIPADCELRWFLTLRLVEELEQLDAEGSIRRITDSQNSIWLEHCVVLSWAELVTRRRLKERISPIKKKRSRKPKRKDLEEEEKTRRYDLEMFTRAGQLIGQDATRLITLRGGGHEAIDDDEAMNRWTDEWNASGETWGPEMPPDEHETEEEVEWHDHTRTMNGDGEGAQQEDA